MSETGYQKLKYFLIASLIFASLISLAIGAEIFSIHHLWNAIIKILKGAGSELNLRETIIWELRLPRIFLSILMGASLSASGVVAQGIFRNALADPGVIGVSAGAALFAIIGISLGIDEKNLWATPFFSAVGASFTLVILFLLSRKENNFSTILLIGFALSSLFGALINLLLSLQNRRYSVLIKIFDWLLGNFEGKGWSFTLYSLPFVVIGLLLCFFLVKDLDLLHLGSDISRSLGSNQRLIFLGGILSIGILVGTVTAMVGMISFIGLMVPHISRFIVGGTHKKLLVISILLGGLMMLIVDTICRNTTSFGLPPGVITSFIGAPFFLWLVNREKTKPRL